MFIRPLIKRSALFLSVFIWFGQFGYSQSNYTLVEDDEYKFSVMTQAEMSLNFDTLKLEEDVPYIVYSGSYVTESDTIYYRIDVWENPLEQAERVESKLMLDSTLVAVGERLRGELLYVEPTSRNSWPARLARYQLNAIDRQAKVLLVKRESRYYLLTVVMAPASQHHKDVNRFLHSFKVYE